MANLLTGKTQRWQSWDVQGRVTAAVRQGMRSQDASIRWQFLRAQELSEMSSSAHSIGLALWVIDGSISIRDIALSVRDTSQRNPRRRRVCFMLPDAVQHSAVVVEAGAQIVVSQLPFLLESLPKLLSSSPEAVCGMHPFTVGLLLRLPWTAK